MFSRNEVDRSDEHLGPRHCGGHCVSLVRGWQVHHRVRIAVLVCVDDVRADTATTSCWGRTTHWVTCRRCPCWPTRAAGTAFGAYRNLAAKEKALLPSVGTYHDLVFTIETAAFRWMDKHLAPDD